MPDPPHDPRAIANLMLDEAGRMRRELTHLALQKLLYFAHGLFLVERKKPLVTGYFEAWQFGPVHPAVFQAFRSAGNQPIGFRARRRNLVTGEASPIETPDSTDVLEHVAKIIAQYGVTPGRLVDISHAKGGPWWVAVDKSRTGVASGPRIANNLIAARFKYHKVSVGEVPAIGEPGEDTPPT